MYTRLCEHKYTTEEYVVGVSMSICEETTTLIFLDLELVQHFITRNL
jgi:hypothetical protein